MFDSVCENLKATDKGFAIPRLFSFLIFTDN